MRLATARDEIEPLRSVEVRQNEAYLTVLLLARTITRVGEFTEITPELVESLYAVDFDHLQRLYERINSDGEAVGVVSCPACSNEFEVDLTRDRGRAPGGMMRPSPRSFWRRRPVSRITSTGRLTRSWTWNTPTGASSCAKRTRSLIRTRTR